MFSIISPP